MLPPSPPRRRPGPAAFLPPLAALAALAAFAAYQADPQAATETAFLALLATVLLAAVAAVETAPGSPGSRQGRSVAPAAAVLVVLAVWALPAGPLRGAAVAALLVAALAMVAGRRLTAGPGPGGAESGAGGSLRQVLAVMPLVLPLALAIQVLVRSDRLLAPELGTRFLVGLLGLPLAAAAAAAFLTARSGRAPALVAVATAALVGPGFTTLTAGALVALAGAEAAWRPRGAGRAARGERLAGVLALGAATLAVGSVEPWAAAVVGLAALLLGGSVAGAGVVSVAAAAAAIALPAADGWGGDLATAATAVAPLALVVALAAASREGRRWALAAVGAALLAAVAARTGGGPPLLAAPLALVPLVAGRSLSDHNPGDRHALFAPQVVWSAALLAAAVLAAAYPWLRPRPLAAALALVGLDGDWAGPVVVAAVAAAAAVVARRVAGTLRAHAPPAAPSAGVGEAGRPPGALSERATRSPAVASRAPSTAAALAAAALLVALAAALPSPRSRVSIAEPRTLDLANPRLEIELEPAMALAAGELVLVADTSLSHAVAVTSATPVATVTLVGGPPPRAAGSAPTSAGDGQGGREGPPAAGDPVLVAARAPVVAPGPPAAAWTLTAGRDTAEWSIRRPDVALLAAHPEPEPWLARVAADGFFGLVFRSRAALAADGARRLVVERHPALPPETVVHLHRLEVRR